MLGSGREEKTGRPTGGKRMADLGVVAGTQSTPIFERKQSSPQSSSSLFVLFIKYIKKKHKCQFAVVLVAVL